MVLYLLAEVMDDFADAGMSSAATNEIDGTAIHTDVAAGVSTVEQQSNVVSTESEDLTEPTITITEEVCGLWTVKSCPEQVPKSFVIFNAQAVLHSIL